MTAVKTEPPHGAAGVAPEPFTAKVAVVAHRRKTLGGGLLELRSLLHDAGITDPSWFEVPKSKKAPKQARAAVKAGAELLLVWGGDGMVQRCIDAIAGLGDAGANVTVGIIPAGTANLLATNLGIPHDLGDALDIALSGRIRRIDIGVVNGEHFGVMAGAGFDARMIDAADAEAKTRHGSLAYVRTGASAIRAEPEPVHVLVDGVTFFEGPASCVLVGNVPRATGGLLVFEHAQPDDGLLDVGVVTADGAVQWLRVLTRVALHRGAGSPFIRTLQGRTVDVRFERPTVYELDGGTRAATDQLCFEVKPRAVSICVPGGATPPSPGQVGSER
jgi:YegS/Rv2252/BmrU family lipid kinase